MRILRKRLFGLLVAALFAMALLPAAPALADESAPAFTEARGVCLTDTFGNVLYGYNEDLELPPASLTKIVTAMVVLDSGIPLDTSIAFVESDYIPEAQLAGYRDGDVPTLYELMMAMLVFSANDASTNLALAVSGSVDAFADLMNAKVEELGLTHTHFTNPHGLEEEGHYSSASDMCAIGRYALEHYPFIRNAVHTPSVTLVINGYETVLETTDVLMGVYDGLLGIKTGNEVSGASFLSAARRNNVTLYGCVLCCDTKEGRWDDSVAVLDWGFELYQNRQLADDEWVVRTAPWQDGFWLRCPVTASRDAVGSVRPDSKLTFTSVMLKPATLVGRRRVLGSTVWSQEGRLVQSVHYRSGQGTTSDCAWSPLVLPAITGSAREW